MKYQISHENWSDSKKKWKRIIKDLKSKPREYIDLFGEACGYCDEFRTVTICITCPLCKRKLCFGNPSRYSAFWELDEGIKNRTIKRPEALRLATKIYNSILRDKKYVYHDDKGVK